MIRDILGNSNFWLGTCFVMFAFIAIYPMLEYNINCPMAATDPDGNESCIWVKGMLWNVVALISLGLDGDGAALSESIDEQHSRNVVPILVTMVMIMFYQKSKD